MSSAYETRMSIDMDDSEYPCYRAGWDARGIRVFGFNEK